MLRFINCSLFLALLVAFASCGDLYNKKTKKEEIKSNQFATCELHTEAFTQIFSENINGDLNCLHENLKLFMRVVRTDKPGFLSRKHIKIYVEKNLHHGEIDPMIFGIIDTVFDLNNLMFGDDKNYISPSSVASLIGFFVDLNKEFVDSKVWAHFLDDRKVSYEAHMRRRSDISQVAHKVSARLDKMFVMKRHNLDKINLHKFLNNFKNKKNKLSIKKIKSLLFTKRIFLGGRADELNYLELKDLFEKFGTLSTLVFDVMKSKTIEFPKDDDISELDFLVNDIVPLRKTLFYGENSPEVICHINDIKKALSLFVPSTRKYLKYNDTFIKVKEVILEGQGPVITAREVGEAFRLVSEVLTKGQYFYRMYAFFENELSSPKKLTDINSKAQANPELYQYLNFQRFPVTSKEQSEFRTEFARIAQGYRFFKGEFESPYYADEFRRNAGAFFEISVLETIVKKFFKHYGDKHEQSVGGYRLTQEQLVTINMELSDFLIGEQIVIKGREKNGAETATLMSSLFQYQSDGDSFINVNEATEFALSILTALDVGDFFLTATDKVCTKDEHGRMIPECFKTNFVSFLSMRRGENEEKEPIGTYMPRLMNYFKNSSPTEIASFINETEKFARLCTVFEDGREVPMSRYDMMSIFGGMINVEQTMARFDVNQNNILDPSEVDEAYKVYENAIRALIPEVKLLGMNILQPLAKKFFLYLIKYKSLPDPKKLGTLWDFVHFLMNWKSQKAPADRMTIATILKTLAVESPANKENPFDCSTLDY